MPKPANYHPGVQAGTHVDYTRLAESRRAAFGLGLMVKSASDEKGQNTTQAYSAERHVR